MSTLTHGAFNLERTYRASPERVFKALSDTESRSRWGAPSADEALVFDNSDFRVGGLEISHCGPKDNLMFRVEAHYLAIEPQKFIVFSENVSGPGGALSSSLISFALSPVGEGTRLEVSAQIVSYVGDEMVRGNLNGLTTALRNLQGELGEI
ncbi:SRPBCC domain-containing protein [Pelagibacterium limicola]|uniref:SRPBCC domain-containing protein n=1 Tax=Pelagibacterium limicola TaxID=2791022 RepID=UPI0018AF9BB7|nr:SRPBCC domain-containing protein [Pelagibacterium limicola]